MRTVARVRGKSEHLARERPETVKVKGASAQGRAGRGVDVSGQTFWMRTGSFTRPPVAGPCVDGMPRLEPEGLWMIDEGAQRFYRGGAPGDEVIEEIVRRVLAVSRPDRIILFGSAASGRMSQDSDVDLLVLEREVADARRDIIRIREALAGLPFPFDVVVMSRDRFEETRNVIGGIAWPAARYGRVIYEAA